ncbi:LAME_0B03048g1_1 [Lachancea meyersii CBS 8951]|uniref:LAME_0B03048g1_1 n=1 Tax=Lachancea meyersii CBS 8951 TaxID=1266667 RepID=A0A1G4IU27_9SACH|nr:LAME_0B03048g1_1 [Lachancea meyersii CBS 8951]
MSGTTPTASYVCHHNKLTKCFDDIMKTAAEMLVQQQIKSIQLSSDIAAGFTQSQHKLLGEKVHTFHSVLDDLDLTLTTAKNCVDKFAAEAVERREKLLEQQRMQQMKEEKLKQEQEDRKRLADARKVNESAALDSTDYSESTPSTFLNELSKSSLAGPNLNLKATAAGTTGNKNDGNDGSNNNSHNASGANNGYSAGLNDLNDLDLSMFGGIEQNDLGLTGFDEAPVASNNDKNPVGENGFNASVQPNNDEGNGQALNNDPTANNTDSYLTLNDFNDLGLDWNTSEGQNALDMSEFDI